MIKKLDSNKIVLHTIPIRITAKIILWFLILIAFILPVAVTVLLLSFGSELHPVIVLFYAMSWGTSYYLFRVLSWNTSGHEIITLAEDAIIITSKSKHFTYNTETIEKLNAVISIKESRQRVLDGKEIQMGKFVVKYGDKEFTSNIELPYDDLMMCFNLVDS